MLTARVRSAEPTGVCERGKGIGRILQEPGRSYVRPTHAALSTGLNKSGKAQAGVFTAKGANEEDGGWGGEANP